MAKTGVRVIWPDKSYGLGTNISCMAKTAYELCGQISRMAKADIRVIWPARDQLEGPVGGQSEASRRPAGGQSAGGERRDGPRSEDARGIRRRSEEFGGGQRSSGGGRPLAGLRIASRVASRMASRVASRVASGWSRNRGK